MFENERVNGSQKMLELRYLKQESLHHLELPDTCIGVIMRQGC